MNDRETQPFEPTRHTAPLDEYHATNRSVILNSIIDQYCALQKVKGIEVTAPHTNEDVNWVLKKYSDEHKGLTQDEKKTIRRNIETIFDIRVNRNQGV